jgi:hypothetical protein
MNLHWPFQSVFNLQIYITTQLKQMNITLVLKRKKKVHWKLFHTVIAIEAALSSHVCKLIRVLQTKFFSDCDVLV